jgi:hypothetical protein
MALKANEIRFVANDTLPSLRGTLTEDDGTPVNLTDCTVNLHIKYDPVLVKTATIVSAIDGIWLVEWEPGDLKAGKWFFEIQVTDSNGDIRTWRKEPSTDKYLTMVIDSEIA